MTRFRTQLLASLGLLVASTIAVFALLEWSPGGPIAAYLQNPDLAPADLAVLNHQLGRAQPFYVQYFAWLWRVVRGDFGWSTVSSQPVSQAIGERLPATIELAAFALAGVIVVGALAGSARARSRSRVLREGVRVLTLAARAVPVLMLAPALALGLMFSGWPPLSAIPVVVLALSFGAWSSLIFYDAFRRSAGSARTSLRVVLEAAAATAARLGPSVLAATILIETMFGWPGAGRLFQNALSIFDPALAAGLLLAYSAGVVLLRLCDSPAPPPLRTASRDSDAPRFAGAPRWWRSPTVLVALVVLACAVMGAAGADVLAPIGPDFIDQLHWQGLPLAPGAGGHLLGTDENGRDLLTRMLFGLRTSLGIAVFAAAVATLIGAAVAKATARFADGGAPSLAGIQPFAMLPFVFATITVVAARAHSAAPITPFVISLVLAVVSWPAIVPALRAFAPPAFGAIVALTGCMLTLEVSLSMRGFGVQPPGPSLGNTLVNAESNMTVGPWIPIIDGITVIALLFALYALADALGETRAAGSTEPR